LPMTGTAKKSLGYSSSSRLTHSRHVEALAIGDGFG